MTREEAKEYVRNNPRYYLQPDKTGKGYICPICGSGSGKNGTGITTKDGIHFTCWGAGSCFKNADIIDIIGLQYGLTDSSKFDKAYSIYNIQLEDSSKRATAREDFSPEPEQNQPKTERITQQNLHNSNYTTKVTQQAEEPDYSSFYLEANKNLAKTDYLQKRGISFEVANRFQLGYVENYRAHNKLCWGWNCLIIPTSKSSYQIRNTDPKAEHNQRYKKWGKAHLFNIEAIETADKPIFITEGELDALSIIEAGGVAVGLGSKGSYKDFLTYIGLVKPKQPLIPALDHDKAAKEDTQKLIKGLQELSLPFYEYDILGENKDPNEALTHNREDFTAKIQEAYRQQEAKLEAQLEAERELIKRESVFYSFQGFLNNINKNTSSCIPTGFAELDNQLDGGLYAGLYVIGAISSLGKTTFCLQIADQIARAGHDVLIFSLEMGKYELMAKSVSRLTFTLNGCKKDEAKTIRGVLTWGTYPYHKEQEKKLFDKAKEEYLNNISENLFITEGLGDIGVVEIREKVEKYMRAYKKAPVVLIDYLQILKPLDMRATDKQNTDIAVSALKRLSRDKNIPILAISSFNRESYTEPVNLTSYKESGAIEYSSDVLIGLQYEGMDWQKDDKGKYEDKDKRKGRVKNLFKENDTKGKKGEAVKIELKLLKNRNGSRGGCNMYYYPMFNYFTESLGFEPVEDEDTEEEQEPFFSGF